MRQFTDNKGRSWEVRIDVAAIKRVKGLAGVDLLDLSESGPIFTLQSDPILLVDVLYALCRPQATASSVTDEDFGGAMAGEAIGAATEAIVAELVAFFPYERQRAALARVVEAMKAAREQVLDIAEARIADGQLERAVAQALANSGLSSGVPPGSSESTPPD